MIFVRKTKYAVLKLQDIDTYLTPKERNELWELCRKVNLGRCTDLKKQNSYVVVNEDEPYAEAVWELIAAEEERKG